MTDKKPTQSRGVSLEPLASLEAMVERAEWLEQELERSQKLVLMGTLAGTLAHEFNNLLTPVLSYAQLALQEPDDAELVKKALVKAVETTERASGLAASLLGFLKEGPGEEHADVTICINEALACLVREPRKDGIEVFRSIDPEARVAMRPVALQQVLVNLFLNACVAMAQSGGGRLDIEARGSTWNSAGTETPEGACGTDQVLTIRVKDTGCGIDSERLPTIFDPFVTFSGATARESSGHGLGLAVCKRLVDEAGGTIQVTSERGKGTEFTIVLPASHAKPQQRTAA